MIAGKTELEIELMPKSTRSQWYKTILPKEKEEAMRMMENIRRTKISIAWIDRVVSGETCAKISASQIGEKNHMYGKVQTKESNVKRSATLTGKIQTEETKTKRREWWTPERRAKMRAAQMGENNPNWRDGISFESYGIEFNDELKEQIRRRDNYTSQICGKTQEKLGCKLDVHHIDYDKTNNRPENLICLCRSCHMKTNYNREDWIEYFREMIEEKFEEENKCIGNVFCSIGL